MPVILEDDYFLRVQAAVRFIEKLYGKNTELFDLIENNLRLRETLSLVPIRVLSDDPVPDSEKRWEGRIIEASNAPVSTVALNWQDVPEVVIPSEITGGADKKLYLPVFVTTIDGSDLVEGRYWCILFDETETVDGNEYPRQLYMVVGGTGTGSGATPSSNAWHHVAGEDWPDDTTDVFLRKVVRSDVGILREALPRVEKGKRPKFISSGVIGSGDGNTATSTIDTTGANGLFLVASWDYSSTSDVAVSDSKGNTWIPLSVVPIVAELMKVRVYYVANPIVGISHSFTVTGTDTRPTVSVATFKCQTINTFDSENNSTTDSDTVLSPGAVTSSTTFSIMITGLVTADDSGDDPQIDSDFTVVSSGSGASNVAGGLAWKILNEMGSEDPEWSWGDPSGAAATIAVFAAGDRIYEHADLPFRCVDPDDGTGSTSGTVSHEIDVKKDIGGKEYTEWAEWYSLVRRWEMTGVVCNPGTLNPVFTSFDHIQSFFNTPILTEVIIETPPPPPPPPPP